MPEMPESPEPQSPLDAFAWPEQLDAHVVDTGYPPTLHGYDLEADLARHYGLLDVVLLALGGELCSDDQRQAIEVALIFACACSVAEAPVHAARVARVIGVRSSAIVGIAALGLAEQARDQLEQQRELLAWLGAEAGEVPAPSRACDASDAAAVARLREALHQRGVEVPALRHDLGRQAAVLAVLWWAGVREPERLETVLVLARLATATAEALAARPLSMKSYPTGTPAFDEVMP